MIDKWVYNAHYSVHPSKMSKALLFYAAPTPNGHKVAIMLEELKAAYGNVIDYE
jgi:hypothetical protein